MTLPFSLGTLPLPNWMPWWLAVLLILLVLVYGLLVLSVPFGVFGLNGRMAALDARLDDIQDDIRALTLRLATVPEPPLRPHQLDRTAEPPPPPAVPSRPPIPPAAPSATLPPPPRPLVGERLLDEPTRPRAPPARPARSEPRVEWPRGPAA